MHAARAITKQYWLPTLLILAFCAYVAPWLNSTINYDEAVSFFWYAKSPIDALFRYSLPNNHLINSFFTWASTAYFGRSEFAIRLPSFFVGMMAVAAVYRLTERMWGRMSAVAAVVMLATSAAYIEQAAQSRGYVWSILFGTLLLMVVLYRSRSGYAIMLLAMLLMLTLPTMALLIGAVGLWSLRYRRHAAIPLIVGTLMGTVFYGEAIVTGKIAHFTDRFGWYDIPTLIDEAYYVYFRDSALLLIGSAVALVIGFAALRRNPRLLMLFMLIIAAPLIIAPLQFILSGKLMYARLYMYLLIVLVPVMGLGIASLAKRYTPLVLIAWALFAVPLLIYRPSERHPVYRLLTLIDERVTPGSEAVLIGCCLDYQVEYYKYQEMWLFYPYQKERLYVVTTQIDTLDRILAVYDLNNSECIPAHWPDFEVYECIPKTE